MTEKKIFTLIEEKIMRILYYRRIPFTYYEIAKRTGVSYPTAKIHTDNLIKMGILKKITSGRSSTSSANPQILAFTTLSHISSPKPKIQIQFNFSILKKREAKQENDKKD